MKKPKPLSHLYRKIITFGCSYTAGSELLDHEIHARSDEIKRRLGLEHWWRNYRLKLSAEQQQDLEHREGQLVWSAEIARRSQLEFENRSVAGSSMAGIVDRVERAWYEGALHSPDVLALVGVTCPYRGLVWFGDDQHRDWIIHESSMPAHWHMPTIIDFLSDQHLMHQHLTWQLRLAQISDRIQGRLLMFDMSGQHRYMQLLSEQHSFYDKWRELLASGHTRYNRCLIDWQHSDENHGGGHAIARVHAKFAIWAERQIANTQVSAA